MVGAEDRRSGSGGAAAEGSAGRARTAARAAMARSGTVNFRPKESTFIHQEEIHKTTCDKIRQIEVFTEHKQTTWYDESLTQGPTRSTAQDAQVQDSKAKQAVEAERPAGKPSTIGQGWGIM